MKYKVIKCKKCGYIRVTMCETIFKCLGCGKSSKVLINNKNSFTHYGVDILFSSDDGMTASNFLMEFKKRKANEVKSDFHYYKVKKEEEET